MKKLLLLTSFIGISTLQLQAQQNLVTRPSNDKELMQSFTLKMRAMVQQQEELKATAGMAYRTTGVASERLIASSGYNFFLPDTAYRPYGKNDSATYKYSGTRGSVFNYNSLSYGFIQNYAGAMYDNLLQGLIVYSNYSDFRPELAFDSVKRWTYYGYDSSGIHVHTNDSTSEAALYNGSNLMLTHTYSNASARLYTYNIANHCTTDKTIIFNNTTLVFDTLYIYTHIYDGMGRLVTDSASQLSSPGVMDPAYKWTYSYDGAGNIVSATASQYLTGAWRDWANFSARYNTDNKISVINGQTKKPSGIWTPAFVDSFGYNAGIDFFTYKSSTHYADTSFPIIEYSDVYTKHVNGSNLPDTLYYSIMQPPYPLQKSFKTAFVYDAYRNPVTCYQINFIATDRMTGAGSYVIGGDYITHYYYQPYTNTVSTEQINSDTNIIAYPNPSGDEVHVAVPADMIGKSLTINITNLIGKIVGSNTIAAAKPVESLSMAGLNPGVYFLSIRNEQGAIAGTQKIIRN